MQVLFGNVLGDLSDKEILTALRNGAILGLVQPLSDNAYLTMLTHYRQYMRDGMSDAWVTNEMQRRSASIAGTYAVPTTMQIASFVSVMKQLKAGQSVQDPNERPSWNEVLKDNVVTNALTSTPAKSLMIGLAGIVIAYGVITTATSSYIMRRR